MTTIIKDKAETIYINHATASYGIFCYNSYGDLFLNSDWGFYGYAWRNFGTDFKEFLSGCNADYIIGKFAINWNQNSKPRFGGDREKNIKILVEEFLKELKMELAVPPKEIQNEFAPNEI